MSSTTFKTIGKGTKSALARVGKIVEITCTGGTGGGTSGNAATVDRKFDRQIARLFKELNEKLKEIERTLVKATKRPPK
ncbi:MAG: hypothetical protein ABI330_21110 [Caldimonas sp.]